MNQEAVSCLRPREIMSDGEERCQCHCIQAELVGESDEKLIRVYSVFGRLLALDPASAVGS